VVCAEVLLGCGSAALGVIGRVGGLGQHVEAREQPAANELGGGPVRHVRPTELERLAGPSAPCSATPHTEFDLTPRLSQRAEQRWCMRLSPSTSLGRGKWLRLPDHNWL
jgi:hypothetical protein